LGWGLCPVAARGGPEGLELHPSLTLFIGKRRVGLGLIDARLLRFIQEKGSLAMAAKELGLSYRSAWGRIRRLEKLLGFKLIEARPGGRGGGSTSLTPRAKALLAHYRRARKHLFNALEDLDFWGHIGYRLSARNRLEAKVVGIRRGAVASQVTMELLGGGRLVSIISNEAISELGLKKGDRVLALVKATDVMVAKPLSGHPAPA